MSQTSNTWPEIQKFAVRMEGKLAQNRHKGDRAGWLTTHPTYLINRLLDETAELYDALDNLLNPEDVWAEAADVANFAMMVADSYAAQYEGDE